MHRVLKSILEPPAVVAAYDYAPPVSVVAALLPAAFISCMLAFTAMRRANLAHFLKPHQVSVGLAVAWTVTLTLAAALSDSCVFISRSPLSNQIRENVPEPQ